MRIVLIVEDSDAYRRQVVDGLKRYHHEFELLTAENGQDAVNVLKTCAVDIVVTDLNMPIMDGFALLNHLRHHYPHTPAIVLTGLTRPDVFEKLAEYGDLHVLQKPAPHERIAEEIRSVLDKVSQGGVRGITLANLLQLLSLDRRSCAIRVESAGREGSLHFISGDLINAEVSDSDLSGDEAAFELLSWPDAHLELIEGTDELANERLVSHSLDAILAQVYGQSGSEASPMTWDQEAAAPLTEQAAPADPVAKERPMSEVRQTLEQEAAQLQETFKRLQAKAQEAEAALSMVMAEFETFREQQRSYQEAEKTYGERQRRLEQLREGAEALAQQLLSVVKQVDADEPAKETA